MILYCDSSVIVKVYVDEAYAGEARRLAAAAEALATIPIAYPEVLSALARRQREGSLVGDDHERARSAFLDEWPDYYTHGIDVAAAADLVERHPLRTLDAIHLAAALELARALEQGTVTFITYDERQREAALAEGLRVLPERGPNEDEVTNA
jgi:predicted nucleic acid-binding protein